MCAICCILCACSPFKSILDQHWDPGILEQQQPQYQPVKDCTYCPVLGSFKDCNII